MERLVLKILGFFSIICSLDGEDILGNFNDFL